MNTKNQEALTYEIKFQTREIIVITNKIILDKINKEIDGLTNQETG